MTKTTIAVASALTLASCIASKRTIDLQGHRGCRGILPENTHEAFIKALEIGVTTLEMDVVISKDKEVVVSHEPFFSHEIAISPKGDLITEENEKEHNLYQLTYEEIQGYDVGLRPHARFPKQEKIPAIKPLMKDVIAVADSFAIITGRDKPMFNIEIKREPELDSVFQPPVEEFVQLVLKEVQHQPFTDRVCLQSFDLETLRLIKQHAPEITLALLIETEKDVEQNIKTLGFKPDVYSPYFELITEETMDYCRENDIPVIPWTVNEKEDLLRMLELGVDGIITDYPNEFKSILEEMNVEVL
ncbi:MAG: glycerophosphodiester phosphodiesterase family protein [Crocinitomicaceae bacterium]